MRSALLVAALLLAGCLTFEPQAQRFRAEGSRPVVHLGYDHAGQAASPGEGTIAIDVDPQANTGSAVATFTYLGQAWRAAFDRFAETRPFQEGGVRSDFPEHGASGNGDALLPQIHALNAGWGTGTLARAGQPFPDPVTGNTTYNLHYMVTDTAPRDAQNRIARADNATYDPASPGDAVLRNGTLQVLLNVQSPAPAPPPDISVVLSDTVNGPGYQRSEPFDVNVSSARVTVNFTATNPTPLPTVGVLTFAVVDPAGQALANWTYDPTVGGTEGRATYGTVLEPPLALGTYSIQVTGTGATVTYSGQAFVDYVEPVFFHVVYHDARVG